MDQVGDAKLRTLKYAYTGKLSARAISRPLSAGTSANESLRFRRSPFLIYTFEEKLILGRGQGLRSCMIIRLPEDAIDTYTCV